MNDLRALEKIPGKSMLKITTTNTETEFINKQRAYLLKASEEISTSNYMGGGALDGMKDYRKSVCPDYVYYTCSFWLKINQKMSSSKIRITVNSSETSEATFDNSAIDSWQFVSIPITILKKNINFSMKFLSGRSDETFKIAEMRLCYNPSTRFCLTDGTDWAGLDDVVSIKYFHKESTTPKSELVTDDFYISEKDLQSTYISLYNARRLSLTSTSDFVLSACDCTKKILVNKVILCVSKSSNTNKTEFELKFGQDDYSNKLSFKNYGTNTRAQYFYEMKSPDGDLYTYGIPHFLNGHNYDKQLD